MHETVNEIIKEKLANGIINSIVNIPEITLNDNVNIEVTKTKNYKFGDYTTNVLSLFSIPQECMENIANKIISNIKSDIFEKIVFVKPCFINFYLSHEFYSDFLNKVLSEKDNFGKFSNKNLFYNIEFVSANPTGLMHVGHARTAAYGDSLTKIFNFFGIKTNKEYYINDAGNQIDNLGYAVYVRYLQLYGNEIKLPDDSYHGEEIITCAEEIKNTIGDKYIKSDYKDKEVANYFKDASINYMLDNIKKDLSDYGVNFDIWFSEKTLHKPELISKTLNVLADFSYTKEEAVWLKTTNGGDDKDRVLVKANGDYTYFLPDIIYHYIKFSRGYDKMFDLFGADHKSYVCRLKIALSYLKIEKDKLEVLIQQIIHLTKNGQEFKMSKRTGNSLTARDLLSTIGLDAARWYLVSQSLDSHLIIDVEKVKENNNNNPLFYVQYAHARICQLLKKYTISIKKTKFDLLTLPIECQLISTMMNYKTIIEKCANSYQVHLLNNYLIELSKLFHSYYANNTIIDTANELNTKQRMLLCIGIKNIIASGLKLLGITPAEEMAKQIKE